MHDAAARHGVRIERDVRHVPLLVFLPSDSSGPAGTCANLRAMRQVARPQCRLAIPRGVWALGFVSLFMDISSEMIHALLPVFLVSVLGASVAAVGLLEGAAEAIASITKVFSGTLSDRLGKRKLLTVVGYGLAALTKPLFALAPIAGLGLRGARHRPRRQGHPRRAARRVDRRADAGRDPRRRVRPAADARHDRRIRGAAHRDRTDGGDGRFVSHRVLARSDPGRHRPSSCSCCSCASRRLENRGEPFSGRGSPRCSARSARGSGGSCSWPRCSRSRVSAKRS